MHKSYVPRWGGLKSTQYTTSCNVYKIHVEQFCVCKYMCYPDSAALLFRTMSNTLNIHVYACQNNDKFF